MSITSGAFKIIDQNKDCFRIDISNNLLADIAVQLRKELSKAIESEFDIVYIDAKNVIVADLSGINEIIHSHYTLEQAGKKLVFIYKKNSSVDTWVTNTGLGKFIATAIVPPTEK